MKLSVIAFESVGNYSMEEQTLSCLNQLYAFLEKTSFTTKNVLTLNFFFQAENKLQYSKHKRNIEQSLPLQIKDSIPIAYLAQQPANGQNIAIEVHYTSNLENTEVIAKKAGGICYLTIEAIQEDKILIANGVCTGSSEENIAEGSELVFNAMEKILHAEGMNFSNIFRQWNYIEDITNEICSKKTCSQNYQHFNDIRSNYYSKTPFKNGYPAATGIGISAGGVIVSFYARSGAKNTGISVENSLQKAAFNYSEEVLIGNAKYNGFTKSSPKFSRAKLILNRDSKQLFISGTASIREEKTIGEKDVEKQTEITIENIDHLLSEQTLNPIGELERKPKLNFFRAYIKNVADYQTINQICNKRWPNTPGIYVVSDVCRENLLVEIEALATL